MIIGWNRQIRTQSKEKKVKNKKHVEVFMIQFNKDNSYNVPTKLSCLSICFECLIIGILGHLTRHQPHHMRNNLQHGLN